MDPVMGKLCKVGVRTALAASITGAVILSIKHGMKGGARDDAAQGDHSMTIRNVSRRFVAKHLASQPEMVEALSDLSHMCTADESGHAQETLRVLVFHLTQLVHHVGKSAACTTRVELQAYRRNITTLTTKVQRDCRVLKATLQSAVGTAALQDTFALLHAEAASLANTADIMYDSMRQTMPHGQATSQARQVAARTVLAVTPESIAAFVAGGLPSLTGTLQTLAEWACTAEPSPRRITQEKLLVHKLAKHLLQLQHATLHRRVANAATLRARIHGDLKALRKELRHALPPDHRHHDSAYFERPFLDVEEHLNKVRVGLL